MNPEGIIASFRGEFSRIREERAAAATTEKIESTPSPTAQSSGDKAQPITFKALSVDDQGVILGIGAYAENVDLDDEVLRKGALVKMSYDFCAAKDRVFKANHSEAIECDLVASWPGAPILKSGAVLKAGEAIPEDDPVMGISLEKGAETAWFVAVKPHDTAVVELARKGGVAGFSWGAYVSRAAVEE